MKRSILGILLVVGILLYVGGTIQAQGITQLSPETVAEFEAYVKDAEGLLQKRIDGELPFLSIDEVPERRIALRKGTAVCS
jgi:hypothetical protein